MSCNSVAQGASLRTPVLSLSDFPFPKEDFIEVLKPFLARDYSQWTSDIPDHYRSNGIFLTLSELKQLVRETWPAKRAYVDTYRLDEMDRMIRRSIQLLIPLLNALESEGYLKDPDINAVLAHLIHTLRRGEEYLLNSTWSGGDHSLFSGKLKITRYRMNQRLGLRGPELIILQEQVERLAP